jgi:hypothetical protein
MITWPSGSLDPGITYPCAGGVETWMLELVPFPPSGVTAVPDSTCQSTLA